MTQVAGVDGCRAGWIVVLLDIRGRRFSRQRVMLCERFTDVLACSSKQSILAVDIPIGLLDEAQPGGRSCDHEARRLLGRRASSVFSPPSRRVLTAKHYAEVRGEGLTRQAFGILPKVREVDRVMTLRLQNRVYEAHPELAFCRMAGEPMRFNKKTMQGRHERLCALKTLPHAWIRGMVHDLETHSPPFPRTQVAPDDLFDASVLAYTAFRIARKKASPVPSNPTRDRRGLRMEIWY